MYRRAMERAGRPRDAVAAGPGGAHVAPTASAAAESWRVRGAVRHEGTCIGGGLLTVLVERSLKPREGPVTLCQADSIDGEIVHQTDVEHVRRIAAAAHAGGRLLSPAQCRSDPLDVF